MEKLPNEINFHIFNYLSQVELYPMLFVSKYTTTIAKSIINTTPKSVLHYSRILSYTDMVVKEGYYGTELFKWALEEKPTCCTFTNLVLKSDINHIKDFLAKYKVEISMDAIHTIIKRNEFEIFKYLISESKIKKLDKSAFFLYERKKIFKYCLVNELLTIFDLESIIYYAVTYNKIKILNLLYGTNLFLGNIEFILHYSSTLGHVNIINWLYEITNRDGNSNNTFINSNLYENAIKNDQMEVIQWLQDHNIELETNFNYYDIATGDRVIKWLYEVKKMRWCGSTKPLRYYINTENLDGVKWVLKCDIPTTTIANCSHLEILKLLELYGIPLDYKDICYNALDKNRLDTFYWAYQPNIKDNSNLLARKSIIHNHFEVLKLLSPKDTEGLFYIAVLYNRLRIFKWLCDNDTEGNLMKANSIYQLYHHAFNNKSLEMIELLFMNGCKPNSFTIVTAYDSFRLGYKMLYTYMAFSNDYYNITKYPKYVFRYLEKHNAELPLWILSKMINNAPRFLKLMPMIYHHYEELPTTFGNINRLGKKYKHKIIDCLNKYAIDIKNNTDYLLDTLNNNSVYEVFDKFMHEIKLGNFPNTYELDGVSNDAILLTNSENYGIMLLCDPQRGITEEDINLLYGK